jgi:hypothetical protein
MGRQVAWGRVELVPLELGAQEDVGGERNIDAGTDCEAVEHRRIQAGTVGEGEWGTRRAGTADTDSARRVFRTANRCRNRSIRQSQR